MKKKLVVLAVVVLCAAIAASGTYAYFTDELHVHNVVASGGIGIRIVEKTKGGDGVPVDFPEEGIRGIVPGAVVSKIVQIQNIGANEAWVRVKVDCSITGAGGDVLAAKLQDGTAVMTYEVQDGWQDGGDGYFYYEKPVATQMLTQPLLREVVFDAKMGNEYQNCTAKLVVSAQAVQTANNGGSVTEAAGWPVEEGGRTE